MSVRICWLGHAALLLEHTSGTTRTNVLIDPFLTGNPAATARPEEVPADYVLVSHGHDDHLGDTLEIAARTGATVVANYEISVWLAKKGVQKVHGMQHGGGFGFPFGRVKMTLAFHGSVLPDGSYGGNPAGFYLAFNEGPRIYDAADTSLFGDMRLIGEEGVDLAFLPIGDNYTMGPTDAIRAIHLLQPKKVIPIHYNTFDAIKQDANAWANQVRKETKAEPIIPAVGEWVMV